MPALASATIQYQRGRSTLHRGTPLCQTRGSDNTLAPLQSTQPPQPPPLPLQPQQRQQHLPIPPTPTASRTRSRRAAGAAKCDNLPTSSSQDQVKLRPPQAVMTSPNTRRVHEAQAQPHSERTTARYNARHQRRRPDVLATPSAIQSSASTAPSPHLPELPHPPSSPTPTPTPTPTATPTPTSKPTHPPQPP